MITFESIKAERPDMSDGDISAFLRFAANFDCLDSDSYKEAHERIGASMELISDEMECASSAEEAGSIFLRHYNPMLMKGSS